ncbi:hypothetical protein BV25DRAFT_1919582 [Artomyces pyxidatus]|uniref:Uncharacterized protein n=1 Tax=Artomyces pyxidatus TaxID=48021 RepID=A0ACB8SQC8_9AGAM|nr:hypothetical protein BV25DRAFT_1919582 [Artomyces pyxidatus]
MSTSCRADIYSGVHNSHWDDLPVNPSTQPTFYASLARTLNAITSAMRHLAPLPLDIVWHPAVTRWSGTLKPQLVAKLACTPEDTVDVWWRTTHVPLMLKAPFDELPEEAAKDLLKCMRLVLSRQPDRRFMFGLIFVGRELTAWRVDRSRHLAVSSSFDIHKHPKVLIRLIAGLVSKSTEDLGWDPTMLACTLDDDGQILNSGPAYLLGVDSPHPHNVTWLASVDRVGADDAREREEFVLFQGVSLEQAAPYVFECQFSVSDHIQIYVFKDAWTEDHRELEGVLYLKASGGAGVATLYAHGVVRLSGAVDSTVTTICSLIDLDTSPPKPDEEDYPDTNYGWRAYENAVSIARFLRSQPVPRDRIHSRLVTSSTGWPLVQFHSLPELLGGPHDAIEGHRWLYKQGILHRNVNVGNICLTGRPAPHRAILVDLEDAIEIRLSKEAEVGTLAFMSAELMETPSSYFYPVDGGEQSLGQPLFSDPTNGEQGIRIKVLLRKLVITHGFVHDLESFFWVLCWLCIFRDGPEHHRRLHWHVPDSRSEEQLQTDIESLWGALLVDTHMVKLTRRLCMRFPHVFEEEVLWHRTLYFGVLRDVLANLYGVLRSAYLTRQFSALYDEVLDVLECAAGLPELQAWNATDPEYEDMEKEVLRKRGLQPMIHKVDVEVNRIQLILAPPELTCEPEEDTLHDRIQNFLDSEDVEPQDPLTPLSELFDPQQLEFDNFRFILVLKPDNGAPLFSLKLPPIPGTQDTTHTSPKTTLYRRRASLPLSRSSEDVTNTTAPPVELHCGVFARFLARLADESFGYGDADVKFKQEVANLTLLASGIYDQRETDRTVNVQSSMSVVLDTAFRNVSEPAESVLNLKRRGLDLVAFPVYINAFEFGTSDPTTQCSYAAKRAWVGEGEANRIISCCPTFLLSFAGPWLFIQGGIFTDRWVTQRLVPAHYIGRNSSFEDGSHDQIARLLYALHLDPQDKPEQHPGWYPQPTFYSGSEDESADNRVSFRYLSSLYDRPQCAAFIAQMTSNGRKLVVKFVERYGAEVHQTLAETGYAPALLYCGPVYPHDPVAKHRKGTLMVVMEFVDGLTVESMVRRRRVLSADHRRQLRDAVAVGRGYVHGDMRRLNVMVTRDGRVQLLDFDWAGENAQVRYPVYLRRGTFVKEVQATEPIIQAHDVTMLAKDCSIETD